MSGGCDRQRDEQEAQIDRLRRDRDEALQKEARATAALVAAREDLEAARADREAAERRIQLAVVAFDALRAAATSERTWIARLPQWDALGRALRGVPAAIAPNRAGPWIEISPGKWRRRIEGSPLVFAAALAPHPDDPGLLVWCAWRPGGGMFAERDTALDLQAAKNACDVALVRAGWGLASVEAGSIEDRLAEVEARLAKLEGGTPQPVIEAPGYVPASGCAECGNVPGMLHGVDCSQSNESRARRWAAR